LVDAISTFEKWWRLGMGMKKNPTAGPYPKFGLDQRPKPEKLKMARQRGPYHQGHATSLRLCSLHVLSNVGLKWNNFPRSTTSGRITTCLA